ncbi:MerC domain-containing protein [Spectribacter hydrogenoxidans]|uniref:MerC domain-containing protein n=1 Tax=Spectribacter hydrogenoxidans TaxID=3075608 RepID=A0ABU3BWV2_9GAMM|nr:MerC domain-containing protein [Salinisphaera sp. W335]MDT0633780.1 MerC domain-containing protein [Salinisphaera sp. W335]
MRLGTAKLDGLAVAFSAICLVHCLMLPVAVTMMPVLGATLSHGAFHDLMLIVVLPTSLIAFGIGCHRHRSRGVAALGGLGLAMLIVAALAVDSVWGEHAERSITMVGGLVLAAAHILNFRLCRRADCPDHCH